MLYGELPPSIADITLACFGIVCGFTTGTFGYRIFRPCLIFAVSFTWVAGLLYAILNDYTGLPDWADSLIAVLTGICAGLIGAFLWQIGMVLLGAMAATSTATMILSLGNDGLISIHALAYLMLVLVALAGAMAILFLQRLGIMISSSVLGAYSFVVSIAACASPNSSTVQIVRSLLWNRWHYPDNVVTDWETYVYFSVWIVLSLIFFFIQWRWTAYIISWKHHDPWIHERQKEANKSTQHQDPQSIYPYNSTLSLNA